MKRSTRWFVTVFGVTCGTMSCRQVLQIDDGELFDGATEDTTSDNLAPDAASPDAASDAQQGDATVPDATEVDSPTDAPQEGCGTCSSPPNDCFQSTGTCNAGICTYSFKNAGTPCDGGLCTGMGSCMLDKG